MRSALYYPYTAIEDVNLIKTALLLWDHIESIVPFKGFAPSHNHVRPGVERALDIVSRVRVPNVSERMEAHRQIEGIVRDGLPAIFTSDTNHRLEIYPQKFLPETWDLLQEARATSHHRRHFVHESMALLMMSVLADCCAGSTRSRVTDRGEAYATLMAALGNRGIDRFSEMDLLERPDRGRNDHLVAIKVNTLDVSSIGLSALIRFREREELPGGKSLRDLRHRYVEYLESYVHRLTTVKSKDADIEKIRHELADDMERDLRDLQEELELERRGAILGLLSKEFLVTAVAAIGSVASIAYGTPVQIGEALSVTGALAAVGGLFRVHNSFMSARRATLSKHPMAYMYQLRTA